MDYLDKNILIEYLICEIDQLENNGEYDFFDFYYNKLCNIDDDFKLIDNEKNTTKIDYKNKFIDKLKQVERHKIIQFMKNEKFYGVLKLGEEVLKREFTYKDFDF